MNEQSPERNHNIENLEIALTKEAVVASLQENPENAEILRAYIDSRIKQIQAPYVSREDTEKLTFCI